MHRFRTFLVLSVPLLFVSVSTLSAAPTVTIGTNLIEAAPNQLVEIFVTSDPGDPEVAGVELNMQIGDGFGPSPEPIFQSFDFSTGIFGPSPTVTGGVLGGGFEQFAQTGGSRASGTTPADGLLVSILIDASGFTPGDSFDLRATGTDIGVDSQLFLVGAADAGAVFLNGTIEISAAAIPEPGTSLALAAVFAAVSVRRRRAK